MSMKSAHAEHLEELSQNYVLLDDLRDVWKRSATTVYKVREVLYEFACLIKAVSCWLGTLPPFGALPSLLPTSKGGGSSGQPRSYRMSGPSSRHDMRCLPPLFSSFDLPRILVETLLTT